jgi:hypothetical protein
MQSTNQHANALQSMIAIYLRSTDTSERVMEIMAHMGISVSVSSCNNAISSLSKDMKRQIEAIGQTLTAAYCYDNINIPYYASPGDHSRSQFVSMTNATLVPMAGVNREDLKLCEHLWGRNPLNRFATNILQQELVWDTLFPNPEHPDLAIQVDALMDLDDVNENKMVVEPQGEAMAELDAIVARVASPIETGEPEDMQSALDNDITVQETVPFTPEQVTAERVSHALKWHIMRVIVEWGCAKGYKFTRRLRKQLSTTPGEVLQIPIAKTEQIPLQTMQEDEATTEGNINVCEGMLKQTRTFDSGLMSEYVTIIHGDLGTLERIEGAKFSRHLEKTGIQDKLQYIIEIPGLFHAKMAAANSMHLLYFTEKGRIAEKPTFWSYVNLLRPGEMKSMSNKPSFRQMHNCIQDVTTAIILNLWRQAIPDGDLQKWFEGRPYMSEMEKIADGIMEMHVAGFEEDMDGPDEVHQDHKRMFRDFLLYSELSHSMNTGDIGRVMDVIPFWVLIWRATKKHKYASYYHRFLIKLHTWPKPLTDIICRNWLCNPTGKPFGFRGVDWLIELNNLYTKHIFGGHGPNRCIELVMKYSPLIQLLRACHTIFDNNFYNLARTQRRSPVKNEGLIEKVVKIMEETKVFEEKAGRKSIVSYRDAFTEGMEMLGSKAAALEEGEKEVRRPSSINDLKVH